MNASISRLLPKAIFLSGALFTGWAVQAQSTGTQPQSDMTRTGNMHHRWSPGDHRIRYSPEQRKQAAAINKDYHQRSEDLFKKDNLTMKDYKAGLISLQKERKSKLEALLTPEQKNQRTARAKRMSENRQVMAAAHLERMKLHLDLTDDQLAKIKSSEENFRSQLKALHQNEDLLPQQKREQMHDLAGKHRDLVKSVLTPEQQAKFNQMMQRRSGEGRHRGFYRRGPMGPGGPGRGFRNSEDVFI